MHSESTIPMTSCIHHIIARLAFVLLVALPGLFLWLLLGVTILANGEFANGMRVCTLSWKKFRVR